MKKSLLAAFFCCALIAAPRVPAQSGCADSPENPTLVLSGLAFGAYALSRWRSRRQP